MNINHMEQSPVPLRRIIFHGCISRWKVLISKIKGWQYSRRPLVFQPRYSSRTKAHVTLLVFNILNAEFSSFVYNGYHCDFVAFSRVTHISDFVLIFSCVSLDCGMMCCFKDNLSLLHMF